MDSGRLKNYAAVVCGALTIGGFIGHTLAAYIAQKAEAAVIPVKEELMTHEAQPGHKEDHQALMHMDDDLEYIKGKLDILTKNSK